FASVRIGRAATPTGERAMTSAHWQSKRSTAGPNERMSMEQRTAPVTEHAALDGDWELLARDGGALDARDGAVRRLVQGDDPRADVLCTRFLDHAASTGDLQEAFDTAI